MSRAIWRVYDAPARSSGLPLFVLHTIHLEVDAFTKVTAISRAGKQQFASLLSAVRLNAPFLDARDKHAGVERSWLRLLL